MRILHIIPSLDLKFGGPSKAVKEMCLSLRAEGVLADIATTHTKTDKKFSDDCLRVFSFPSILGTYRYSRALNIWLERNIPNYDLVHIHSIFGYPTLAAARISEKYNKPYIIRTIGQLYNWTLTYKGRIRKKVYLELFEKKSLRNAAALHFTTEDEKINLAIKVNKNHYILPLGVHQTKKIKSSQIYRKFSYLKNKKYILFLSRIHQKKGLDLLIPAIRDLLIERGLYLILAGDGEESYLGHIRDIIRKNRLENRVFCIGHVSGEEKDWIMQNAEVFVLPSYTENFGLSVIEAMESGTPIAISRNVGTSNDIKKNNAGVVFDLTLKDIENSIKKILDDFKLRETLVLNAKKMVRREYNWKNIIKRQVKIYQEIIKKNNLFRG